MRTLLDLQIARDLGQDSGLSDTDYDVLSILSEGPGEGWRSRDLGARLFWSSSRLAHHIGRMEQRGLVARQPCPGDARGAIITLTPHGRDTLITAAPLHVASVRRDDPSRHPEQRALAGAILARHHVEPARFEGQRDVAHCSPRHL